MQHSSIWRQSQPFILASSSPRRRDLLSQQNLEFSSVAADIDEAPLPGEAADAYVLRLAIEKAKVIAHSRQNHWIIGSDTTISHQNQILGKPENEADCVRMLRLLSGKTHQVYTAVALVNYQNDEPTIHHHVNIAQVTMSEISATQASAYWHTGEPADKAGSYAIQGIGGCFVARCEGSYSAIVGLPLVETLEMLRTVGVIHEC